MNSEQGFILTRQWRDTNTGVELEFWVSTAAGPRCLRVSGQHSVFFVPADEAELAQSQLANGAADQVKPLQLRDFSGAEVSGLYFTSQKRMRQAREALLNSTITPLEADINPCERYLMERFIAGSVCWAPASEPLRLAPADYAPQLKMLSVDIETAMRGVELYSIAVYGLSQEGPVEKVFMLGSGATDERVEHCVSERALLTRFCQWLDAYDPDVLIGWNVVNFDLWFLQRLADKLGARLPLGRGAAQPHWRLLDDEGERRSVQIPGRVVLDGIEVLRSATYRFESFSLESVSRELLGEGKLLTGNHRGWEIGELFRTDQNALAAYNLRDCELVWAIFEQEKLLDFAIARSRMTGLAMDRLGGSVAAFDHLYLPRLHREGFVAPNPSREHTLSPGGFVLDSSPGIYRHVLLLDFKSLYPSIIRSFCVDPMGLAIGLLDETPADAVIDGFQGGRFHRHRHLLPAIIEELWQRRDEAKATSDQARSQAIKIIMNSFYGVLGSPGCRFFDARLASSITRRGHEIIQQTRDFIEQQGEQVIYGDTDSVFVWLQGDHDTASAQLRGRELQQMLNDWWEHRLRHEFKLDSVLELEFETHFERFLMPTVRGSDKGSKKRYAGVVSTGGERQLVFKGLETVRTDWTRLAREFQSELYRRVFFEEPYEAYIGELTQRLLNGELDDQLIYRKRLRRRLQDYQKSSPPHVQAARLARERGLPDTTRGDWVEYVVTLQGPEPAADCQQAPDYHHYLDRQLAPVADGILHFLGTSFAAVTEAQITLF